jgi:hypothetical protein
VLYPHLVTSVPERAQRASAGAALATVLAGPLRSLVVPLLEDRPRESKLRAASGVVRPPVQSRDTWICELLSDENTWVVSCAAYYTGAKRITSATDRVISLLERPSPIIRETALEALEAILPVQELPRTVAPVLWDDFQPIKKRVDRMLDRIIDQVELDRAHGTVEEVLPA